MKSIFCLALLFLMPVLSAQTVDLRADRLSASLGKLSGVDQQAARHALDLIRKGEHSLALGQLTALTRQNPNNSSIRILASYALLQLGNMVGAFREARKGESSSDANDYACWFLAKVSWLAGDKAVCRREVDHLKHAHAMPRETEELERQLKR